ncbi:MULTISPECIES: hypothetical protein [Serratia]|uniref:hypothetical protein n=1 Tax=Serratia TaxID=613 RepID=UPI0006689491|nr:hypothetical protein [Serratia marcescens]
MGFVYGKDYTVYDHGGDLLGTIIGDEFIRSKANKLLCRIDGEEIYSLDIPCKLLGFMDGLHGKSIDGSILFTLESESSSK